MSMTSLSQSRGPSIQPGGGAGRYEAPTSVRSHLVDLGVDELRLRALEMEAELEASAEETDTIDMLELARSEKLLNELEIAEGEKRRADFERFGSVSNPVLTPFQPHFNPISTPF